MVKHIVVVERIHKELVILKAELGAATMSEAIEFLLEKKDPSRSMDYRRGVMM